MSPLRVVFAGTPDFAASSLAAVLDSEHEVVAVYTQPDRPAGRGRKLTPSPVKQLAQEHGLPVVQPASLKDADDQAELAALNADVMVVVAYGLLLPQAVLDTPRLGCINVHASLLPRWRGAAPIQRAIEAGDSVSGVTIMQMDAGLDTGAMLYEVRTPITSRTTGGDLHDRLAIQGANALIHVLDNLDNGSLEATPQPEEGVTYAAKLSKAEAELDFSQPAEQLARKIRAFNPWPVAWCTLGNDRLRLLMASVEQGEQPPSPPGTLLEHGDDHLRIACGEQGQEVLCVSRAQLPGGKAMAIRDLLNARQTSLTVGVRLGQTPQGASQ
ncbi:MAG: methionyl-tRNA formyltransferase [Halomonas sp.]|jgi:methionyl-tRNA formyltransferase|uniref:methionyl-tRNA formyltransferase n=1 Tax=Halomonadaceae TaxID=28256 RepID=UPI0005CC5840|nr:MULTISPECIES: methionyl-tRNA formyltransferase [Halomonas]KJD19834.1 methionyl-tRNA formyltransferase [Halomonas meridiana]MCP1305070.1 methionyl-tRNA formyltransferase [Halomonas sp. R1t8]MCP1330060.1 methionyl-tRNA formyltransferase [Halomonas sp. R1t4]PHR01820.1 MAG: methionyl-tRNA formyltransferase [Halomonas sp.]